MCVRDLLLFRSAFFPSIYQLNSGLLQEFFFCVVKFRFLHTVNCAHVCDKKHIKILKQKKMKQRKLNGISFSSDECNGLVKNIKRTYKDAFRSTNGNHFRNIHIKIDKPNTVCVRGPHMTCNRSQRCLTQNTIVQTSFRTTAICSKFAFHRIICFIVILLFAKCCTANGQQSETLRNVQNSGE